MWALLGTVGVAGAQPVPDLEHHQHAARTGAKVAAVGVGVAAAYPLAALAVCGAAPGTSDDNAACLGAVLVGIPVELAAAGAIVGGASVAVVRSDRAVRAADPSALRVGAVVLPLVLGGTAAIAVAAYEPNETDLAVGGIGTGMVVGGLALGAVQYVHGQRVGPASVAVGASPSGVVVRGTF